MSERLSKLKAAQEERRAKAAASGGGGGNFFRVKEDSEETIRFLEDIEEILTHSAYFHEMEPQGKKRYGWFEICLDQDEDGNRVGTDCPGCEINAEDWESCKRKLVMYANVIWRDAPIRKKDDKGKYVDTGESKDQLALWEIKQSTVQDALEQAHLTYKQLTTRDFIIRRRGTGFDTTYSINPVTDDEGNSPKTALSKADKELVEGKADLSVRVALKEVEDWGKLPKGKAKSGDGEEDDAPEGKASDSPFLNRNKKKTDD